MQFDDIYDYIGHLGIYQVCILAVACMLSMFDAEAATMVFVGGSMDHWCRVDDLADLPHSLQRSIAIPSTDGVYSSCEMYDCNYTLIDVENDRGNCSQDLRTVDCTEWIYDQSTYVSTIVRKFDLVCDKTFLTQLVSSVYMIGGLIGSLALGALSDRIGRKSTLQISLLIRLAASAMFIFAPNYIVFIIGRFFLGFGGSGCRIVNYILAMEIIGPRYRSVCSCLMQIFLSIGIILVPLIAMSVRHEFWYQIVFFTPLVIFLPFVFFVIPESPRWLFTHEKYKQLNDVFHNIAVVNGVTLPVNFDTSKFEKTHSKEGPSRSCMALFQTPTMRLQTIVMSFAWFSVSLIYYALLLNIGTLPGDIFFNASISGVIEIPGLLIGAAAARFQLLGRRITTGGSFLLTGIANFICIPLIIFEYGTATTVVSLIGKIWLLALYGVIIIYLSELFPTEVRNQAMGSALMFSRIGSAIAPYMGENLTHVWKPLPSTIIGVLSTVAGSLLFLLPETKGEPLYDTIEEMEGKRGKAGQHGNITAYAVYVEKRIEENNNDGVDNDSYM